MPQAILPIFPGEATQIEGLVSFSKRDGQVYYFHGCAPVFSHGEKDRASFRMFTSQLVVNGNCQQKDIVRAFGVSTISVKRSVKKYRKEGAKGFFVRSRERQPRVLRPEVVAEAQRMLGEGKSRSETAQALNVKTDTFSKAIRQRRIVEPVSKKQAGPSQRKAREA
jgi:hypothetical protein